MSAILYRTVTQFGSPYHEMSCARPDLVIATRATIVLDGPRSCDRPHLVVIAVGSGLDTTRCRQRCT
jgi:hypothetical protein